MSLQVFASPLNQRDMSWISNELEERGQLDALVFGA